jgi:hypothetical protein
MKYMNKLLVSLILLVLTFPLFSYAGIQVNPTGVNVNKIGATTVFLTFGGLDNHRVGEGVWCGEIRPAKSGAGSECVPGTIFGVLPQRFDFSSNSSFFSNNRTAFTDIMSIPPSVARRAFQAAMGGATSGFFYVRRFISESGGPDVFVPVTCRMSAGGARTPLSLTSVNLIFERTNTLNRNVTDEIPKQAPFKPFGRKVEFELKSKNQKEVVKRSSDLMYYVKEGDKLPKMNAEIVYTGTGRLNGRWEVVLPGDAQPSDFDLLPESTLPVEQRGLQRRYTHLERFNVYLPPVGKFTLEGPDPRLFPTSANGLHQILLRIEPSDEKDSQSNLASAGAGIGIAFAGGVAGFPMPPLRYYVLGEPDKNGIFTNLTGKLELIFPPNNHVASDEMPLKFTWTEIENASLFQIQIEDSEGKEVLSALLKPGEGVYSAPPWLKDKTKSENLKWRIRAVDNSGREIERSKWRNFKFSRNNEKTPSESAN